MRPQRIGLIALLTVLATVAIDNVQFIQNPKSQILNSQVLAQTPDIRKAEAERLFQQGIEQYKTGQFEAALQSWQQALAIYREIKDRKGEGDALSNLGIAYKNLGDYAKAIDYYQQSLAIKQEIKDRQGEGNSLSNLGGVYYYLGDYAKAIEYYQQSLVLAREIKHRLGEGESLGNLGNAYFSLADYAKAIEYYQQDLAITREIKYRLGEGQSLNNLGVALLKQGNLTQAEKILRDGIDTWESLRERLGNNDAYKVSIFEQQARTYRTLQQVLIAQNHPNAALAIAERGRARAFVELLRRRNATKSDSPNSPITPPTIEQLQQIAKQQNATLVEYSIIYEDFKIKGKEESHESELYIWVIKPTGEVTFRRSALKPLWQQQNTSLDKLVTMSRESIGVRSRGLGVVGKEDEATQTNRLQQLHQILIQPIANLL